MTARLKRIARLAFDRVYLGYAAEKISRLVAGKATRIVDRVLRMIHAGPAHPNGRPAILESVKAFAASNGIPFLETGDIHGERGARVHA